MLKSVLIKNFKNIAEMKIELNNTFNLIIGENNIGKTTIFEAIHLWKICFDACMTKKKNSFYVNPRNLQFVNMESIRIYNDIELFNDYKKIIEITVVIEFENIDYTLGFKINAPRSVRNAYLQLNYVNQDEFKKFAKMVNNITGKSLASFININEAKTLTNIVAKEPYMYKDQIKDKISKGKSYEVLRNKINLHKENVEKGISDILGSEFEFNETDKENRTYIDLNVNGNNILSYGSGFLQLAEIFSSIEFSDAKINILLLDEPDAHLHFKIQKKLIEHLKEIEDTQILVITHNEKFIDISNENEILFIGENNKHGEVVKRIPTNGKLLIKQNLSGELSKLDKINCSDVVIIVEGETDEKFMEILLKKNHLTAPILDINGIDDLIEKVKGISTIIKKKKIFILRDTDWTPISRIDECKNTIIKQIPVDDKNIRICFQNGYGIESSLISDIEEFFLFISKQYYDSRIDEYSDEIKKKIIQLNTRIADSCKKVNDKYYKKIKYSFEQQKKRRSKCKLYSSLCWDDIIKEIEPNTIQYIMNKEILQMYLNEVMQILKLYDSEIVNLDSKTIICDYLTYISAISQDAFKSHMSIVSEFTKFC